MVAKHALDLPGRIAGAILFLRGEKVMLDRHLADSYGVEVKVLNQAVKRNRERFPSDFMFQLTPEEARNLKSQLVTSSWGGARKLPYAFTEHGAEVGFEAWDILDATGLEDPRER